MFWLVSSAILFKFVKLEFLGLCLLLNPVFSFLEDGSHFLVLKVC